jgi:hypothetical protein
MMDALSIKTVVPCNFDNLSLLLMICHLWLPLLGVPLAYLLLPSQRLSEDLLTIATGSTTLASGPKSALAIDGALVLGGDDAEAAAPLVGGPDRSRYGSSDC